MKTNWRNRIVAPVLAIGSRTPGVAVRLAWIVACVLVWQAFADDRSEVRNEPDRQSPLEQPSRGIESSLLNQNKKSVDQPDRTKELETRPIIRPPGRESPQANRPPYPWAFRFDGHKEKILAVTFSPDSRYVASADASGMVIVWDLETRKERHLFRDQPKHVWTLAFSPDGRHLASGSSGREIIIWDVESGKTASRLYAWSAVRELRYLPDGDCLVAHHADPRLKIWDLASNSFKEIRSGRSASVGIAIDGRSAVVADDKGELSYVDVLTGEIRGRDPGKGLTRPTLAVSPGRRLVAHANWLLQDGPAEVQVWPVGSPEKAKHFKNDRRGVMRLQISLDQRFLLAAGSPATHPQPSDDAKQTSFTIWEIESGRPLPIGHREAGLGYAHAAAFSPDTRYAAVGGMSKSVFVWELPPRPGQQNQSTKPSEVTKKDEKQPAPVHRPDWAQAANKRQPGAVALHPSWEQRFEGHTHTICTVVFSPDSRFVASGDLGGAVRVWDLRTGRPIHVFRHHERAVRALTFSNDGRRLISAGDGREMIVWDLEVGKISTRFDMRSQGIRELRELPDGAGVVTHDSQARVRIWDLATGTFKETGIPHSPFVGLSGDGQYAVIADIENRSKLSFWHVPSGDIRGRDAGKGLFYVALAFSPDRKYVALGSRKPEIGPQPISLWSPYTSEETKRFEQDRTYVHRLCISPDRRLLLAVGTPATHPGPTEGMKQTSFTIWDIETGRALPLGHREAYLGYAYGAAFSPDNRYAAVGGMGKSVIVWKLPRTNARRDKQ